MAMTDAEVIGCVLNMYESGDVKWERGTFIVAKDDERPYDPTYAERKGRKYNLTGQAGIAVGCCLVGALAICTGADYQDAESGSAAEVVLQIIDSEEIRPYGWGENVDRSIISFNDDESTTKEQVLTVLRAAKTRAEAQQSEQS